MVENYRLMLSCVRFTVLVVYMGYLVSFPPHFFTPGKSSLQYFQGDEWFLQNFFVHYVCIYFVVVLVLRSILATGGNLSVSFNHSKLVILCLYLI